ncbi:MAG TPA: polysaccharide biosynthesis/export family protein [Geobacteraceae bacterium]
MKSYPLLRLLLPLVSSSLALLAGCAPYTDLPPGTCKLVTVPSPTAVVERQEVSVPPAAPEEPPPSPDYVIGANDVLFINVGGHPEFLVAPGNMNSKVQGSRVDGNGRVNLPMVGSVEVAGLTLSQAQNRLQEVFGKYLQNPWVVVEVAEYKSRPVYLLGQFKAPGTYYLDRPLNLLQGVALGGGFDITADLRSARLTRNQRLVPVDLYDLLTKGDPTQNVWLKAGDTVYIPDNRNQQVFVFGAVKKPGPVAIPPAGLNLAQAIANAELRETGYDFQHVRIIRSLSTIRGELLVVDFDKILRGEALPIQLMAGDIVYVPKSAFGTWNDVIADLLPSLQAVSAGLQPFVEIKFLRQ